MNAALEQPPETSLTRAWETGPAIPVCPPRNTRMRRVVDRARQLAGDPSPLLLRGEYGVGKRTLACLIHQWGAGAPPLCAVVRAPSGGETPSPRQAAERLRQSDRRGTLLLEEIGEFSPVQQDEIVELLAQDAGGDSAGTSRTGIKLLATTSRDLAAAARKGVFREDLLSLLMDQDLYLPPLRERPEDIACLAEQMLAYFGSLHHRADMSLSPEAQAALLRHAWPGNAHELRNAIERAVLTARNPEIDEGEFRLRLAPDAAGSRAGAFLSLDAMERQHILRVVRAAPTLEEAARILQVDITTLWRKRRRYGI